MPSSLLEGKKLYKLRKYSEALNYFLSLPTSSSELSIDLAYYIGLCYARLEKYDDALLYLEQVVTGGEDITRVQQCRLVLAVVYTQTGRVRLADFELQKLLETGCQTVPVMNALAYAAWMQKKVEQAIAWYEKILTVEENNSTALNGLSYVLASNGKDLTRALSLVKRALDIHPDSAACLDTLAWVYYKLGLLKEAKVHIKRAKEKDSKNTEILEHYRVIYTQLAQNNEDNRVSSIGGRR